MFALPRPLRAGGVFRSVADGALAVPGPFMPAKLKSSKLAAASRRAQGAPGRSRGRSEPSLIKTALRTLEAAFNQQFWLVDVATGEMSASGAPELAFDVGPRLALLEHTARRGKPEIIEHESPLSMLAVPLGGLSDGCTLVAVSVFVHKAVESEAEIASAAQVFGVDATRALAWARQAETWFPRVLLRLAESTIENLAQRGQLAYLEHEINEAVAHARDTYAELGLLHRLARRLNVSEDDGRTWGRAVEWLAEVVPAQCLAAVSRRSAEADDRGPSALAHREVIHGECPLEPQQVTDLMERLGAAAHRPLVLGRAHTSGPGWSYPEVHELAAAPIIDGARVAGWLVAINHAGAAYDELCEFGSAELRLLETAGSMLAIHRSNAGLFFRQADLFDASVRALISAIDAKDRYTHGHSERVARVAVCLAEQLALSKDEVRTIYLGGLLHDIGKIGVDDRVLNHPGKLSAEEFDQIKEHPRLGHEILRGVRQLEKILPIVLHHHEAWDGSGYPDGLQGDAIPLLARVVAVADAFDAMSSDRPYRSGMSDEKLETILRDGAGKQWDPTVVHAFFAARDPIRQAASATADGLVPLDPFQWVN